MFYKILETFVTFLVWYSFFLIAFALGFYIMLHKDVKSVGAPGDVEGDGGGEEDYKFFDNPWLSIVKTSTMFVGEIEFSDIPISTEASTWPIGAGIWSSKAKKMITAPTSSTPAWMTSVQMTAVIPPIIV